MVRSKDSRVTKEIAEAVELKKPEGALVASVVKKVLQIKQEFKLEI